MDGGITTVTQYISDINTVYEENIVETNLSVNQVMCRDCDHCKCPKMHLKHLCILYKDLTNLLLMCINILNYVTLLAIAAHTCNFSTD